MRNAILDGEIVCLDENGVSRFNRLLSHKAEPILYAFDLLSLDGKDLRQLPLIERKSRLARIVESSNCERLLFAQHVDGEGKKLFKEICSRDLEGIVAKRKLGIYKDDGNAWLKVKNRPGRRKARIADKEGKVLNQAGAGRLLPPRGGEGTRTRTRNVGTM